MLYRHAPVVRLLPSSGTRCRRSMEPADRVMTISLRCVGHSARGSTEIWTARSGWTSCGPGLVGQPRDGSGRNVGGDRLSPRRRAGRSGSRTGPRGCALARRRNHPTGGRRRNADAAVGSGWCLVSGRDAERVGDGLGAAVAGLAAVDGDFRDGDVCGGGGEQERDQRRDFFGLAGPAQRCLGQAGGEERGGMPMRSSGFR